MELPRPTMNSHVETDPSLQASRSAELASSLILEVPEDVRRSVTDDSIALPVNDEQKYVRIPDAQLADFMEFLRQKEEYKDMQWVAAGQAHPPDGFKVEEIEAQLRESTALGQSVDGLPEEIQASLYYLEDEVEADPLGRFATMGNSGYVPSANAEQLLPFDDTFKMAHPDKLYPVLNDLLLPPPSAPFLNEILDEDLNDWVLIEVNNDDACCVQPAQSTQPSNNDCCITSTTNCCTAPQVITAASTRIYCEPSVTTVARAGFFDNWPSFGVWDKLVVVFKSTAGAFVYGFIVGAQTAIESLFRLLIERPVMTGAMSLATAITATLQPQLALLAIEYVVLGGVVSGVALATPVIVIGSGGVFVGALLYHSYVAARRSLQVAIGSSKIY